MRLTDSGSLFKKLAVAAGLAGAGVLLSLPAVALDSLVSQTGSESNQVNPANPDAEGGEAFEQAPGAQPLPSETTEPMNDSMNEGGTQMDDSTGGGAGGVSNPVNPANPDAVGGEAFEEEPTNQPLPSESAPASPSGTSQDGSFDSQSGTTSDDGIGGGAGGGSNTVRALW